MEPTRSSTRARKPKKLDDDFVQLGLQYKSDEEIDEEQEHYEHNETTKRYDKPGRPSKNPSSSTSGRRKACDFFSQEESIGIFQFILSKIRSKAPGREGRVAKRKVETSSIELWEKCKRCVGTQRDINAYRNHFHFFIRRLHEYKGLSLEDKADLYYALDLKVDKSMRQKLISNYGVEFNDQGIISGSLYLQHWDLVHPDSESEEDNNEEKKKNWSRFTEYDDGIMWNFIVDDYNNGVHREFYSKRDWAEFKQLHMDYAGIGKAPETFRLRYYRILLPNLHIMPFDIETKAALYFHLGEVVPEEYRSLLIRETGVILDEQGQISEYPNRPAQIVLQSHPYNTIIGISSTNRLSTLKKPTSKWSDTIPYTPEEDRIIWEYILSRSRHNGKNQRIRVSMGGWMFWQQFISSTNQNTTTATTRTWRSLSEHFVEDLMENIMDTSYDLKTKMELYFALSRPVEEDVLAEFETISVVHLTHGGSIRYAVGKDFLVGRKERKGYDDSDEDTDSNGPILVPERPTVQEQDESLPNREKYPYLPKPARPRPPRNRNRGKKRKATDATTTASTSQKKKKAENDDEIGVEEPMFVEDFVAPMVEELEEQKPENVFFEEQEVKKEPIEVLEEPDIPLLKEVKQELEEQIFEGSEVFEDVEEDVKQEPVDQDQAQNQAFEDFNGPQTAQIPKPTVKPAIMFAEALNLPIKNQKTSTSSESLTTSESQIQKTSAAETSESQIQEEDQKPHPSELEAQTGLKLSVVRVENGVLIMGSDPKAQKPEAQGPPPPEIGRMVHVPYRPPPRRPVRKSGGGAKKGAEPIVDPEIPSTGGPPPYFPVSARGHSQNQAAPAPPTLTPPTPIDEGVEPKIDFEDPQIPKSPEIAQSQDSRITEKGAEPNEIHMDSENFRKSPILDQAGPLAQEVQPPYFAPSPSGHLIRIGPKSPEATPTFDLKPRDPQNLEEVQNPQNSRNTEKGAELPPVGGASSSSQPPPYFGKGAEPDNGPQPYYPSPRGFPRTQALRIAEKRAEPRVVKTVPMTEKSSPPPYFPPTPQGRIGIKKVAPPPYLAPPTLAPPTSTAEKMRLSASCLPPAPQGCIVKKKAPPTLAPPTLAPPTLKTEKMRLSPTNLPFPLPEGCFRKKLGQAPPTSSKPRVFVPKMTGVQKNAPESATDLDEMPVLAPEIFSRPAGHPDTRTTGQTTPPFAPILVPGFQPRVFIPKLPRHHALAPPTFDNGLLEMEIKEEPPIDNGYEKSANFGTTDTKEEAKPSDLLEETAVSNPITKQKNSEKNERARCRNQVKQMIKQAKLEKISKDVEKIHRAQWLFDVNDDEVMDMKNEEIDDLIKNAPEPKFDPSVLTDPSIDIPSTSSSGDPSADAAVQVEREFAQLTENLKEFNRKTRAIAKDLTKEEKLEFLHRALESIKLLKNNGKDALTRRYLPQL